MSDDLFSPLEIRETEVRNRVMVSPMCQFSSAGYKQCKRNPGVFGLPHAPDFRPHSR
jgi:hypothetical protein